MTRQSLVTDHLVGTSEKRGRDALSADARLIPLIATDPLAAVWLGGSASKRSPAPPIPPTRRTSQPVGRWQGGSPGSPGAETQRPQAPAISQSASITACQPPLRRPMGAPQLPASPLLELLELQSSVRTPPRPSR